MSHHGSENGFSAIAVELLFHRNGSGGRASGGRGAVREVCELIMHAQGTLEKKLQTYLK